MKMKSLLLTIAAIVSITAITIAQNVPSYVPTDGLVGWWPFSGNANDESGNGNDGAVYGASLTNDRNGIINCAYSFDGIDDYIVAQCNSFPLSNSSRTFSMFIYYQPNPNQIEWSTIISYGQVTGQFPGNPGTLNDIFIGESNYDKIYFSNHQYGTIAQNSTSLNNGWHHICVRYDSVSLNSINLFIDGFQISSPFIFNYNNISQLSTLLTDLTFGKTSSNYGTNNYSYKGIIDDIGIWNRALSQQEITDLYNAPNCGNNTAINPQINALITGSTATFNATTSDPNPSYVWQSNFGQGYQTLNDAENYSGTNTSTLNIANVQLSEHNQPIRVITTSGECVDTSDVATISILDTCVTSINDTTFITVTDTLVINTLITGNNPPNNSNTIKVYPNPANSHITIEYGDFAIMNGYQLKIENSIGQEVFQTSITQQSDYLNLNSWGGNGLYFVHIVDPQGNTIDIRKIVLQ